ncbi:MAG: response regulator transcription factor [Ignavibacteria bacterium]|jgi:two-component system LytT family response regulator|nr:response regulator transcription factor [Ignavibacteria bacterium]MCU7505144.1 response regulator transcription factor [Ignavibacteria bacterium]MCU7518004.1 response regulator transcription factor [Ignavibacteria bacterium]
MKVLIIEDEALTSRRLKELIHLSDDSIEVLDILDSIESSVDYFERNPQPDLIFMDIQLSDGLSFEIFNRVDISCPVVFTTAFDEYAVQAFRVNSIDYLLKPVKAEDLQRSLDKFNRLKTPYQTSFNPGEIHEVLKKLSLNQTVYKSGFLLKTGQTYQRISCQEVAYFHTENKLTYIVLFSGKIFVTEYTLDILEKELNPYLFFRISRQFIVSLNSVESVHVYFGGSLKLKLRPESALEAIVSRRRAAGFKDWMDQ